MPWTLKACSFAGYPMPQPLKVCIFAWYPADWHLKVCIFTWYLAACHCSWLLLWDLTAAPGSSWLALAPPSQEIHGLSNFNRKTRGFPRFCSLYTQKLKDFRQSSINLSTLRGEFERDMDFTRIFTGNSAPRRHHLAPPGWRWSPQARKSMI